MSSWFSELISDSLLSISDNLFTSVLTNALLSPACLIFLATLALSLIKPTVSFIKFSPIFKLSANVTALFVSLKFVFISSAYSFVKLPSFTLVFNSISKALSEKLFLANSTALLLTASLVKASETSLTSVLFNVFLIDFPPIASLTALAVAPVPAIPLPVAIPIKKVSPASSQNSFHFCSSISNKPFSLKYFDSKNLFIARVPVSDNPSLPPAFTIPVPVCNNVFFTTSFGLPIKPLKADLPIFLVTISNKPSDIPIPVEYNCCFKSISLPFSYTASLDASAADPAIIDDIPTYGIIACIIDGIVPIP